MNNPEKHHFVPEVYLKEFARSQKNFFELKKGLSKINKRTVAQVCYKPNYFKLRSEDRLRLHKIDDPYHIEKYIFKKHENSYPKLVKKITRPSLTLIQLNKSEIILFLEILLTIKKRNPAFREMMINDHKRYIISDEFRKDMELGIEISKKVDNIDPVEFMENFIKDAASNEDKQNDMYLRSFLDKEKNATSTAIDLLLQCRLYIYHAPFGSEFITSDNPGFTLLPNEQLISFGGFGLAFKFIFPLTPKSCLFIKHDDLEENYLLKKSITVRNVDTGIVDTINRLTYSTSIEKVFAYSEYPLIPFTK